MYAHFYTCYYGYIKVAFFIDYVVMHLNDLKYSTLKKGTTWCVYTVFHNN